MDHFIQIYKSQAAAYHAMISAEDRENRLVSAIEAIVPLSGKRILDLGTGTGRLPILFRDRAAMVIGLDLHQNMLEENRIQRDRLDGRWELIRGDIHALPFTGGWVDVTTAGWALGHFCGWYPGRWKQEMTPALDEMHRVTRSGGWLLIMETLSTGSLRPAPPNEDLEEYYNWLEVSWGFSRTAIPTDYEFTNVDAAVAHTEFFFGPELSEKIRANHWSVLPEWTGIWSKQVKGI